jgi:hypothetical protein
MSKSKAYRSVRVKSVRLDQLVRGRSGARAVVGLDVGKSELLAVVSWDENY